MKQSRIVLLPASLAFAMTAGGQTAKPAIPQPAPTLAG